LESTQSEIQPITGSESQKPDSWKQFVIDIIETIVLAIVLYFGINALSARVRVDGLSMKPTLQNGEYILVSRITYKTGEPQRGDIIVFSFPIDENQDLIKRVIGLPGETVSVHDGQVRIDGKVLNEPYIANPPIYNGEWTVSEGQLFVLGDNRNDSKDSHQWGLLPMDHVIGKALVIYWPPSEWEMIYHTPESFTATP